MTTATRRNFIIGSAAIGALNSTIQNSEVTAQEISVKGIGVVSTIAITPAMKTKFKEGVADSTVKIKFSYVGSYKPEKLEKKIKQLQNDSQVGLIVTAGGNKTYEAAESVGGTKPFISLLGAEPVAPSGSCYGGVVLRSYTQNKARVDYLSSTDTTTTPPGKQLPRTKIALLRNPNSAMSDDEVNDWSRLGAGAFYPAGRDMAVGPKGKDENDTSTYSVAFGKMVADGMVAAVISADPFFQDTMDELVQAANDSGLYVTYPLQEYQKAWVTPTPSKATAEGPDLLEQYKTLGQLAKKVLGNDAILSPRWTDANWARKDL